MCGIAGLMDTRGRRPIDRGRLVKMTDRIAHRGPDGDGFYVAAGIGLGHRRLAIIDVAGGQQPLYNEDGTVVVSFNGEIYNFQELATELTAKGHRFRSHCDTEVIVHAWEEWGERCVDRFRGMFAFAIWDEKSETLFLARDRLGKKPLYYAVLDDGMLLFASELKALLVDPRLPRRLDPTAVEDFFAYGYVPETKSIYRDVAKLAPAHHLTVRRGREIPSPVEYWDLACRQDGPNREEEAREQLVALLQESVKLRLISDVPLGAFLSGGVDSSAVVALMAEGSAQPVNSFSIGFRQAEYDETAYADQVAKQFRTNHFSRTVDADDFDLVGRLAGIYDEPFADASAIPTVRVCALAREHVTVALSGDGGDELFAGYRRYRWHACEERIRGMLPDTIRRGLFGTLARLYPKADWAPRRFRAKSTLRELAADSLDGYFLNVSTLDDSVRDRLYTPRFARELQGYHAREQLGRAFEKAPTDDPLMRVLYTDIKTYLPGDILTKVDRASMASSLEVRAPLLDHRFAEWATGLPSGLKLHDGIGKYVFKRALEGRLSHDILYRPKQGFAVPLAAWFRGPLAERVRRTARSSRLADTGWFDTGFIGKSVEQHIAGLRDHSRMLWSLLMFEVFLSEVHDGNPAPARSVDAVA
ncbi:MAG: asparagine synthase [Rhodospirillales bacterium]|nr:asparagine synthase [Rhodospirillales bacterium]